MNREITSCVPELQKAWATAVPNFAEMGIDIRISRAACTPLEQAAIYLRGRASYLIVSAIYSQVLQQSISAIDADKVVTWTLESKHVIYPKKRPLSEALDFYVCYGNKAIWDVKADINNDNRRDYDQVADFFEHLGLRSGRSWGDACHIETR